MCATANAQRCCARQAATSLSGRWSGSRRKQTRRGDIRPKWNRDSTAIVGRLAHSYHVESIAVQKAHSTFGAAGTRGAASASNSFWHFCARTPPVQCQLSGGLSVSSADVPVEFRATLLSMGSRSGLFLRAARSGLVNRGHFCHWIRCGMERSSTATAAPHPYLPGYNRIWNRPGLRECRSKTRPEALRTCQSLGQDRPGKRRFDYIAGVSTQFHQDDRARCWVTYAFGPEASTVFLSITDAAFPSSPRLDDAPERRERFRRTQQNEAMTAPRVELPSTWHGGGSPLSVADSVRSVPS